MVISLYFGIKPCLVNLLADERLRKQDGRGTHVMRKTASLQGVCLAQMCSRKPTTQFT